MAGTVLDEGTDLVPQDISNDDELFTFLVDTVSLYPHEVTPQLKQDLEALAVLHPEDPASGSPFSTSNEMFGLSSEYKRVAAMLGDMSFHAPRREWIGLAAAACVPTWGYIFTDQNADPSLGVQHASEVPYVYGSPAIAEAHAEGSLVSRAMLDYWVSFAVSGTPKDGKSVAKTVWAQYEVDSQDTYRSRQISYILSIGADFNE
ncbi:hypothetical protein V8D89_006749 [Ganoderma adspersum]